MTIPYTYCITHNPSKKRYYGVRTAKGCSPNDLWVTYFTSSETVHNLIKEDGKDSFSTEIRKIFKSANDAIEYEIKVLRRLKVIKNDNWLNKAVGSIPPQYGNQFAKGNKFSESTRAKLREARKRNPISPNKGKICPESAKVLKRDKMLGIPKSDSMRAKLSEIAKKRYKVNLPNGKWTWGYRD